jgi:uridylate kinase
MYKKIVIKLTGHLFDFSSGLGDLISLASFIKDDHVSSGRTYYIVVGGGSYARSLIENLRKQGVNEFLLDKIGIETSRIHALFISYLLQPYVHEIIPRSIEEAVLLDLSKTTNLVMGGLYPGFSTNAVSAMLANALDADVLITMSRGGGLYDKNPDEHPDAQLLKEASINQVKKILGEYNERAGHYPLLDKTAIKIIEKYSINTYIIPPTLKALKAIIKGENSGTHIFLNEK